MARIAEELRQPLMPWQRQVVDVGLELLPDGLPAYKDVGVSTPRQQGKTTVELSVEVHRATLWLQQPQRIDYSAQTGADARKKLLDDQVPLLRESRLWALVRRVYRAVGAEGVIFRTGSRIDVRASGAAAGHGRVVDLGIIDEAFADEDDRREQAVKPAMVTRPDAQLWWMSTKGDETSVYLNRKIDTGRAAVADGLDRDIAYFEWSADPDADPGDPATWRSCMPALGYTISEEQVRHAFLTMPEGEFRRAFLNLPTIAQERVIPAALWNAVCTAEAAPQPGQLVFAVDVAADRTWASIVAADGKGSAEVIDHREGVGWLVARAAELATRWATRVGVDMRGPAASEVPDLEARGVLVERYGPDEMAQACARLYDAIADRKIRVRPHPDLDEAVAGARKRVMGDRWYWARRDARVDISPLVALTVAYDLAVSAERNRPWAHWG